MDNEEWIDRLLSEKTELESKISKFQNLKGL